MVVTEDACNGSKSTVPPSPQIHHELNQFCSKHSLQEVYIDLFHTVDDRLAQSLQHDCDKYAPGTSDLVADTMPLTPRGIEKHFGITGGHIHHVDNTVAFNNRMPYATGLDGLYAGSAGAHPAGSVIGAAGHNAANRILKDLA